MDSSRSKKGIKQKWNLITTLNISDLSNYIKECQIWSIKSKKGRTHYYRCNLVASNGPQCKSILKTVESARGEVNVFVSQEMHDHDVINAKVDVLTKDVRNKILAMVELNKNADEIKSSLDADGFSIKISKIRNLLSYEKRKKQNECTKSQPSQPQIQTEPVVSISPVVYRPNITSVVNPLWQTKIETEIKFYGNDDFETPIILINSVPFVVNPIIIEDHETIIIEQSGEQ